MRRLYRSMIFAAPLIGLFGPALSLADGTAPRFEREVIETANIGSTFTGLTVLDADGDDAPDIVSAETGGVIVYRQTKGWSRQVLAGNWRHLTHQTRAHLVPDGSPHRDRLVVWVRPLYPQGNGVRAVLYHLVASGKPADPWTERHIASLKTAPRRTAVVRLVSGQWRLLVLDNAGQLTAYTPPRKGNDGPGEIREWDAQLITDQTDGAVEWIHERHHKFPHADDAEPSDKSDTVRLLGEHGWIHISWGGSDAGWRIEREAYPQMRPWRSTKAEQRQPERPFQTANHVVRLETPGPAAVYVALEGVGFSTFAPVGNSLTAYVHPPRERAPDKFVARKLVDHGHSDGYRIRQLCAADLLGLGRDQAIVDAPGATLAVFVPADPVQQVWRRFNLASEAGPWGRFVIADLDGNGRPDVVGRNSGAILVHWNRTPAGGVDLEALEGAVALDAPDATYSQHHNRARRRFALFGSGQCSS